MLSDRGRSAAVVVALAVGVSSASAQCELDGAGIRFGGSVAISGDTLIVGAALDEARPSVGSAHVFRREGTCWCREATLTASDAEDDDYFGRSVAIEDDLALVGAIGDEHAGELSGSAYVFRFDGTHWNQEAELAAPDGGLGDGFGQSVSLSGDTALVGARIGEELPVAGSAYVFRFDGTRWIWEAKLVEPDADPGDAFGEAVSLCGDVALIGERRDYLPQWAGAAYVFRRTGREWRQEAKLVAEHPTREDFFGVAVSISGDRALVGAYYDDISVSDEAGAAYLFRLHEGRWMHEARLTAPDAAPGDLFGLAVAIDGHSAVIGAVAANDYAGAAYAFSDLDDDPCTYLLPADLDGDGEVGQTDLLALIRSWGTCDESCPADLTCDGDVGVDDLIDMLLGWGESC